MATQNFGKDIAEHYVITNLYAECDFVVQRNEHIDELIQVIWDMSEESVLEINGKKINIRPAWKWALGK